MNLQDKLNKVNQKIKSNLINFKDLKIKLTNLETELVGLKEEKRLLEESIRVENNRKGIECQKKDQ